MDVGWCLVPEALVVALVAIVLDDGGYPLLERAGEVIVLEQDAVLEGLVPLA